MGGPNSGRRWRWASKDAVESYRALDVRRWARQGYLVPGCSFQWAWYSDGERIGSIDVRSEPDAVRLTYTAGYHGDEVEHYEYRVRLDKTPCHFGGSRVWFRCPARGCGKRVAKLYGGVIFACRTCHQLAYQSQREARHERLSRKAEKIRAKLGWEPGTANGHGPKPKGMHWRTFERLSAQHDAFDAQSWGVFLEGHPELLRRDFVSIFGD